MVSIFSTSAIALSIALLLTGFTGHSYSKVRRSGHRNLKSERGCVAKIFSVFQQIGRASSYKGWLDARDCGDAPSGGTLPNRIAGADFLA